MADEMPADPFHADGPDMTQWAASLYTWYAALQAGGFSEARAFTLTDTFLRMQMMGAAAAVQQGATEGGGV
jgi:hypothetical protein